MTSTQLAFDLGHPLLADHEHLERITDVMYAAIQRTLFPWEAPRRRHRADDVDDDGGRERILDGIGVSADDVLASALPELLQYPPGQLQGSWEGLATTIARRRAIDAVRASQAGLRGTDYRSPLKLVSGDAEREVSDGEAEPPLFEMVPSTWGDPEAEYLATETTLELRDLARSILSDREREVFFAIHYRGVSRREVGAQLGLTGQRIGQIYNAACRRLEAHMHYPYETDRPSERGN